MKKNLLLLSTFCCSLLSLSAQTWETIPGTLNKGADAMIEFDNQLFIGGNFTRVDNVGCSFTATYDGINSVEPRVTDQLGGGGFDCFGIHDGKLYGGGTSTVGSISFGAAMLLEWDGSEWGGSKFRLHSNVYAVASAGTDLIAGGYFTDEDGGQFNYIAKHNGTSYSPMGDGFDYSVGSIVYYKNVVYASGGFSNSGSTPIHQIAKWNGTSWVDVGNNQMNIRSSMVVFKNNLYVLRQNSSSETVLSKWDGTTWTDIPGVFEIGANGVRAIHAGPSAIYIGGSITKVGDLTVQNIVSYDGTNYKAMGSLGLVNTIATFKGNVYACEFSFEDMNIKKYVAGVGTDEVKAIESISIYPNPASGEIRMNAGFTGSAKAQIYDINGKLVGTSEIEANSSINIQDLEMGLYTLQITSDSKSYSGRFIKQ